MAAAGAPRPLSDLRFLIVEDSPTVRLTIRQALLLEGHEAARIEEAEDARRALELFDARRPDVVFLDITLPEGTRYPPSGAGFLDFLAAGSRIYDGGHQVARAMLDRDPSLKIIVCTGNSRDDPRVRELIQAGAFTLLEKPLRLAQIRDALRQVRDEVQARDGAPPP